MKLFGNTSKKGKQKEEITPGSARTERTPEEIKKIDEMIAKYQKKKKKRRIITLSVILVLIASAFTAYKIIVKPPKTADPPPQHSKEPGNQNSTASVDIGEEPIESTNRKDGFYTFIIVGKDDGNGNTDTMMLGAFDSKNKKLNIVNIPRDTMVNVSWSVKKVNTLLAFGGGAEGLKAGIRDLIGFTVDSYIIVDLDAFVQIVDAVGGLEFDVPVDMHYDDPTQDLSIHINAGLQYLDGEDALKVFRFRSGYASADIGRIDTQQKFLKALAKKLLNIGNITKVKEFSRIFSDNVETDLSLGNIIWYGQEFLGMKEEDIQFYTLPENYNDSVRGLSYCSINVEEWLKIVNEYLNPYKQEITLDNVNILTRDQNGNLYATSGEIRGGIDSFFNNEGGHADIDPTPDVTQPATESEEPEPGLSPSPSVEDTTPPDTSIPPDGTEQPGETEPIEETEPPGNTEPVSENTEFPENTEPPAETQPVQEPAETGGLIIVP
jgi:LCP family protein required for cell wall assembly